MLVFLRSPCHHLIQKLKIAAILPLLPAKQRVTDPNDWMWSDNEIACPDPHCRSRLKISRTGIRTFDRAETTVVPLRKSEF